MGRPPSNGGPAFRFTAAEVAEMETILQEHNNAMPAREVLVALAEKFSDTPDRQGKIVVQMKQVWNWFQNKRYAIRAKSAKAPAKLSVSTLPPAPSLPPMQPMPHMPPVPRDDATPVPNAPQAIPAASGKLSSDNAGMEFEAKSARDGAWYDVANFLGIRDKNAADPDVLVRFSGFGPEEDEWLNVKKHVRQRSLPCESSECVAVLPGDLILCFQEGKEQALYFDAHVLDAQRRRHDVRGCRCRFLVRYDHDLSEEIVPLRKICRRPETDYRLQQLHAVNDTTSSDQHKIVAESSTGSTAKVISSSPAASAQILHKPGGNAYAAAVASATANAPITPANPNVPAQAPITPVNPNVPAATNATQAPIAPATPYVPAATNATQAPIATATPYVPAATNATPVPIAPATPYVSAVTNASQASFTPANANIPAAIETTAQQTKIPEISVVSTKGNSDVPPSGGAAPMNVSPGAAAAAAAATPMDVQPGGTAPMDVSPGGAAPMSGIITSSFGENIVEGKE